MVGDGLDVWDGTGDIDDDGSGVVADACIVVVVVGAVAVWRLLKRTFLS